MFSHRKPITPLFLVLTSLFVTCLLISNIIAGKLIQIYGMVLPAAVILFPLTYVFGDILTEVYGFKHARLAIWIGLFANLLLAAIFIITIALPYPEFWKDQAAYRTVLGFTPRLVAASVAAYWVGEFSNSIVLSKMKVLTRGRWLWARTIGSTVVGEGLDTLLFITIAFAGIVPTLTLLNMILAQYVWKVSYEIAVTPVTYVVVGWLKRKEGLDTFDKDVGYNPFKLEVVENASARIYGAG
jgi:uncharacterized integral membrane protein (TIGR00697 family)